MSVAQLLEQAAAAMEIKRQASQALAMQHVQQLQAELIAAQARLAAASARMQGQSGAGLEAEMQKLALLSAANGWNPLGFAPHSNPAAALLQMTTPQFAAAAATQAAADAVQAATKVIPSSTSSSSSSMWSNAAEAAAQWRDSMSKLYSTSASWFPWSR
jgi:hypothetical protein